MRASVIDELGVMLPTPAYTDERIWLYLARECSAGTMAHGDTEEIEVHEVELEEALAMIERGDIIDAKTIAGLHLADAKRRRADGKTAA